MNDDGQGAPDNSAQAPVATNDPSSPPDTGAQEPLETSQQQTPVVDDDQTAAGEPTPTPEPEPGTPEPTPTPFWQAEGFKSEDEFVRAYKEGRGQLGKVHREAADLKRANDIYRKHANNELDGDVNVEEYIADENKKASKIADEQQAKQGIATERANLALETFKVRHKDENLDNTAIMDIIGMASTSQSSDFLDRLEHGFTRYQGVQAHAKRGMVKTQQDDMRTAADMGPGASNSTKPGDGPDYKNMSSEDFAKVKQEIARG